MYKIRNLREWSLRGFGLVVCSNVLGFTFRAQETDKCCRRCTHGHSSTPSPSQTSWHCNPRTCTFHIKQQSWNGGVNIFFPYHCILGFVTQLSNHLNHKFPKKQKLSPRITMAQIRRKKRIIDTIVKSAENPETKSSTNSENSSSLSHEPWTWLCIWSH